MKATGIVRRIDELGRVVIPKELRRSFKINEGDPIEIFVEEGGEVILKKYSPIGEMKKLAQEYADSLHDSTGHNSIITDTESIVAVANGEDANALIGKEVGKAISKALDSKKTVVLQDATSEDLSPQAIDVRSMVVAPIITPDADVTGAVVLYSKTETFGDFEKKITETAASFLGKQIDLG